MRRQEAPQAAAVPGNSRGAKHPTPQLVLAFDFGRRRIGVACGDTLSRGSNALAGITNGDSGPLWEQVDAVMRDWQPAQLVVGLPYNVDGSESAMSALARGFADALTRRYALPVQLIDERYSSLEAAMRLKTEREAGWRRRRVARADVDATAACVILERWFLDST